MSYHDGYYPYRETGIAVVNPLVQNAKKLQRIRVLLAEAETKELTATELREQIAKVLNDYD
jgi:hypothetical protein